MARFSNILHVVGEDDPASGLAKSIALCRESGATLTLASVVVTMVSAAPKGRFHDELGEAFDALRSKRLSHLEELATRVPDGIETVCEVLDGSAPLEIIRRVLSYNHDLVVTYASSDTGPLKRLFASEDMQLLRKCPCPLLLLKRSETPRFRQIFAALAFDRYGVNIPLNAEILDLAAGVADAHEAGLDVANVYEVPGEGAMVAGWIPTAPDNLRDYSESCRTEADRQLGQAVSESRKRTGFDVFGSDRFQTHATKGRARDEIPRLVQRFESDLVVMGTVGRVGMPGLLIGNTAETILGAIDCSVLALKPDGFQTPVTLD